MVRVKAHHKLVALLGSLLQQFDVAHMQNVETAVGKDDFLVSTAPLLNDSRSPLPVANFG